MTKDEIKQWLAVRKDAGRRIDPHTAEVEWWFAQTFDPYGINPESPGRMQAGRAGILCAFAGKRGVGEFLRSPRSRP